MSFSLAVPGAQLFAREMNPAISIALRSHRNIHINQQLRDEFTHWLFLETWDDPLPWKDERHVRIDLATDASGYGWGASVHIYEVVTTSDYWSEKMGLDIAIKEALALDKTLIAFSESLQNAWVDAQVDNMAVASAWPNGAKSMSLNRVMKKLFFTTIKFNIFLHLTLVASCDNPADRPSRNLSLLDSMLHMDVWKVMEEEFGGPKGHTCAT